MVYFIIILVIVVLFIIFPKRPLTTRGHHQQLFDGLQFSAQEFYEKVEQGLRDRKIPSISFARQTMIQSHILSDKREYLKISRNEIVFYVCGAPFGTGFFTSWWLAEEDESIIELIPVVNKIFGKSRGDKTYYQLDTEAMYKAAVHNVILSVIGEITTDKGIRLPLGGQLHQQESQEL